MEKIYIVKGTTGEYSDRRSWLVAAYKNEEEAKKHVEKASERHRELNTKYKGVSYQISDEANEYDPHMQTTNYTGTIYYIDEVDLYSDVVEYRLVT